MGKGKMKNSIDFDSHSEKNVLIRRIISAIIDILLIIPPTSWIFYLGYKLGLIELGSIAYILMVGIFLGLLFVYTFIAEGKTGQTLGKVIMKITVVKENGAKCTYKASFFRNLIRIFPDGLILYVVGLISILFSEKSQRLGDYLAGTVVVRID